MPPKSGKGAKGGKGSGKDDSKETTTKEKKGGGNSIKVCIAFS